MGLHVIVASQSRALIKKIEIFHCLKLKWLMDIIPSNTLFSTWRDQFHFFLSLSFYFSAIMKMTGKIKWQQNQNNRIKKSLHFHDFFYNMRTYSCPTAWKLPRSFVFCLILLLTTIIHIAFDDLQNSRNLIIYS